MKEAAHILEMHTATYPRLTGETALPMDARIIRQQIDALRARLDAIEALVGDGEMWLRQRM